MNKRPVIGIFFREGDPLAKPKYRQAYFDLQQLLEALGAKPVIVRESSSYMGGCRFSRHWIRGISSDPDQYQPGGEVTVDALFNRGRLQTDAALCNITVNNSELDQLADDKAATQRAFAGIMPPGIAVKAHTEPVSIETLAGERLVLKHNQGFGGTGVFILPRNAVQEAIAAEPDRDWVVQEYIDTAAGIPNIIDCEHDIRLIFLDGRLIGCVVRPRDLWFRGKHDKRVYRSFMIPLTQVPKELVKMARTVDQTFAGMQRFYSMDFVFTKGRWYLLELNSTSGLIPAIRGPHAVYVLESLADHLVKVAQKSQVSPIARRLQ